MQRKYFIGVDGGGTKTISVIVNSSKEMKGKVLSGGTNHNSVGNEKAKAALLEGLLGVIQQVGCTKEDLGGICLSLSGVDRKEDKELVAGWVSEAFPSVPALIHNDAVAALSSGTGGKLFGIVVISGTGTIAYGYKQNGEFTRAGGWGPLLGDEGSGYHIGSLILKAVVMSKDGTGPKTSLTQEVFHTLGIDKEDDLITWAYSPNDQGWHRFASLSTAAFKGYKQGDQVSRNIVNAAADALLLNIKRVAENLGLDKDSFPLVLAGGNLEHEGSPLKEVLTEKISKELPTAKVLDPKVEPALGASFLAVEELFKP